MDKTTALLALLVVCAFWLISTYLWDYSIPIFALPVIGTILDFKPFQTIAPYAVFIGALLTLAVMSLRRKRSD